MGSSSNTTTQTTTLPGGITDAVNAAASGALNTFNAGNPVAGMTQPVAPLNDWQNRAASTTAGITGYQPQMVSTGYQPQQVTAGSVTQFGSPSALGGVQSWMNPYTSQVIGTSLDELNRQLAKTNQASSGQAAQAGAFGGDRAAIVNTENDRNADQIAAQTIAGLNSQNFTQAATNSQQDATRTLQAGTSQAQLDANTAEANQYAGLQAANLDSTNQRANQSAGLAGQQLDLSAAGQLGSLGAQFRQTTQDYDNSIYNQQYRDAMWPQTQVTNLSGVLGTLAGAAPKTTTTVAPGPSTAGQIAGLGTAALGLGSLTGGFGKLFGGAGAGSGVDAATGGTFLGSTDGLDPSSYMNTDAGALDLGFADGGDVEDSETYAPIGSDGAMMPMPVMRPHRGVPVSSLNYGPVNTQGDYADYSPTPAGSGTQANLGLGAVPSVASPMLTGLAPAADVSSNASASPAPTGLAAADASSAAVDQALAVDPAQIVVGGAKPTEPDGPAIPLEDMPAPADAPNNAAPAQPSGIAATIPTPPVPPPAAPGPGGSRIAQSADPASPIPTGSIGPTQAAGDDWSRNKLGMTLLSAGLGMMASKSHTALGAVGEGGLAGVQELQTMQKQQNDADLRRIALENQAAYQKGMVGIRAAGVPIAQQRVDQQGSHYQSQDANGATRNVINQQRVDQQGDHYDSQDATAQTRADAYAANGAGRNQVSQDRLALQRQQLDNLQAWRAFQQQSKATDQEIAGARSIMNNATQLGKPMTMDQALAQYRSARTNVGPAPIVGAPIAGGSTQPGAMRQASPDELAGAKAAIARGVPRDAVMARFQQNGVAATGL